MHRIDGPGATVDNKFTEGDPVGGVQATVVTDDWLNDVQEEMISVLTAGGVAPVKGTQDQVLAAIRAIIGKSGHGQCRLSVASPTSLALFPYNGNNLIINGAPQQVPGAGVTISNSGLAASTVYYVYAFMSSGTMTLELSTTGHATGTNGIEQKTGDATRTLVGMIRTNASIQFVNSFTQRFCINWFNRRPLGVIQGFAANRSTTSTSMVEISASERAEYLSWRDEGVTAYTPVLISLSAPGTINTALYVNGAVSASFLASATNASVGVPITIAVNTVQTGLEGYFFASVYGNAPAGITATWQANVTVMTVMTQG